jgi:hypothetical protein
MRNTFLLLLLLMLPPAGAAHAQVKRPKPEQLELPELNVIKAVTLSPCYSCRTPEEFARGYEQTALFLTEHSRRRNSPALLFNGFPGGEDYFQVSTAGAEMSAIADLGAGIELAGLTAQQFAHGVHPPGHFGAPLWQFNVRSAVKAGHTYAVIINKGAYRGLLYFTVAAYEQNRRAELRYALKHYEALSVVGSSPGFDWTKPSAQQ